VGAVWKKTVYEVGKVTKPDKFSSLGGSCTPGLHFFPADKFPKNIEWMQ